MSEASARIRKNGGVNSHTALKHSNVWTNNRNRRNRTMQVHPFYCMARWFLIILLIFIRFLFSLFNVCSQMSEASARIRKNGGVNSHTALKHSNVWTNNRNRRNRTMQVHPFYCMARWFLIILLIFIRFLFSLFNSDGIILTYWICLSLF